MQYYFENMAISLLPVPTRNKNVDTVRKAQFQKCQISERPNTEKAQKVIILHVYIPNNNIIDRLLKLVCLYLR